MGCFTGTVKYVLFAFNFLIVVCGITLIAIGGVILANENQGIDSFTDFSVGGFAIAVGVIIFCVAFFGCCGAIKENSCMLTSYAVVLIVLLILQIVLGSLAFVALKNDDFDLDKEVVKVVSEIFEKYLKHPTNKDNKEVVDNVQQYFECCGVASYLDWSAWAVLYDGISAVPPPSCYEDKSQKPTNLYKEGCAQAFKDAIVYNVRAIAIVAIVFAVIEFIGAVFAFIVRNRK